MSDEEENKFLLLGFWEFAIISTLFVCFFPLSLLFCLLFFGMDNTKALVLALLHDAVKTTFAVLKILGILLICVVAILLIFYLGL